MNGLSLSLRLAARDMLRDRFFLFCNVAILIGVLVPTMVLYGVKNGVTNALLGDLLSNPSVLQIDTVGNKTFTHAQVEEVGSWPEVTFVAPRARSAFDEVNLFRPGARFVAGATLSPSGPGDPNLPDGTDLGPREVALSALAADRVGASIGDTVSLTGQFERGERNGNLNLDVTVVALVPVSRIDGMAVLAPFDIVDAFEALYEGYALPELGLETGEPLDQRVPSFEGVRVYARDLQSVVVLESRLGATLDVATRGSSAQIEALYGLSRNLNLVLGITASLAALGLSAALIAGSYADVMRKRVSLASVAMLGLPPWWLAIIPVLQALLTGVLSLALAFPIFFGGAILLDALFGAGLPGDAPIVVLSLIDIAAIALGVMLLTVSAAGAAAWATMRLDPASVLREGQ